MPDAYWEVDAVTRAECAAFTLDMHQAVPRKNEDALFIVMVMEWRHAGRNASGKLCDLAAPEVGVYQVAEFSIFARANYFTVRFPHQQGRSGSKRSRPRSVHDVAVGVLGTAGMHNFQRLGARVLEPILGRGRNVNSGSRG